MPPHSMCAKPAGAAAAAAALRSPCCSWRVSAGAAAPLGATVLSRCGGCGALCVNFAVHSAADARLFLCLFPPVRKGGAGVVRDLLCEPVRVGAASAPDVRHVLVSGLPVGFAYGFWLQGVGRILLDVRVRFIEGPGAERWGVCEGERTDADGLAVDRIERYVVKHQSLAKLGVRTPFRLGRVEAPDDSAQFDWQGDERPDIAVEDLVVYEAHVRGLTLALQGEELKDGREVGTFAAVLERLDYLQWLGVNSVQLLPVTEFNELESDPMDEMRELRVADQDRKINLWGYQPIQPAGYAPMARYGKTTSSAPAELKLLVREMHKRGMECILDLVFNHVGGASCSLHFFGVNYDYFFMDDHGNHVNFSGCGNTLSPNSPRMRELLLDCLRWWVEEYHIDGFRLDAAGVLARQRCGRPSSKSPVLDDIAKDPVLSRVKMIVEPWDAGDAVGSPNYLIGSYPLVTALEWNPDFMRAVRRFLFHGDDDSAGAGHTHNFRETFAGSPRIYGERPRGVWTGVNYVSCHDGFSLADSVAYNHSTNPDAPAGNDGTSYNHGVEGHTSDSAVNELRERQMRNLVLVLTLSRGVPHIWMGCEAGTSRCGDANAYAAQDLSSSLLRNPESMPLSKFTRAALQLRKKIGCESDVVWRDRDGRRRGAKEDSGEGFASCTVGPTWFVAFNAAGKAKHVWLPKCRKWRLECFTAATDGVYFRGDDDSDECSRDERYDEVVAEGESVVLTEKSIAVYKLVE